MTEERKAARLDLSSFRPKSVSNSNPDQDRAAVEEGMRLGFTGRASPERIDGRTLRRKGKSQMNMRITPEVQLSFKQVLAQFPDADVCLAHLVDLYRRSQLS